MNIYSKTDSVHPVTPDDLNTVFDSELPECFVVAIIIKTLIFQKTHMRCTSKAVD